MNNEVLNICIEVLHKEQKVLERLHDGFALVQKDIERLHDGFARVQKGIERLHDGFARV